MDDHYGGTLVLAALSLANEVQDVFGEAKGIIVIHRDCKLMLLPLPSYEILIGLVLEVGFDADDGKIANNIERIVADNTIAAAS